MMWLVAFQVPFRCFVVAMQCFEEIILSKKGEVGWYTHPKGENSVAGCKNPSVGLFLLLEAKLVIGNSHLTSWASMQCPSYSWLALPKQLDHKCA